MPNRDYWETLFDVPMILDRFGFNRATADVVELGCGYGTFTLPLARRIGGRVRSIDLDPAMVAATRKRAEEDKLSNIDAVVRDVLVDGFGVPAGSCDAALLFNIIHCETPIDVLRSARDSVRPGGMVAVIHWRSDISTPRGPSIAIRPTSDKIEEWAASAGGFGPVERAFLLPPWHFGVILKTLVAPVKSVCLRT